MSHRNSVDCIVIGAGIGGLSAAIHLACAGKRVLVLEQNSQVGGKMWEVRADGFRWDAGPSVITMRPVFEDLFQYAGRRLEDYLDFVPVEPVTRYFYPDGVRLDISRQLPVTTAQISRLEERDVEGYLAFLAYAAAIHRVAGKVFIYDQPPTWRSFLKVPLSDYLKVDPLRTMQGAINSFVRSSHLRQLLGRFATYVGASPYLAPATLNVIAHVELTAGVWYPRGGVYSIAQALSHLAEELGVEIQTHSRVERILIQAGKAQGVALEGGGEVRASCVIANVDVATVYEDLMPAGSLPARKINRLRDTETSCSGFILLLGVAGEHPDLSHHNIFFSADYRKEFDDIFRRGVPPEEPTIYLAITSKTDSAHAPAGHENWYLLINVPALSPSFDWASFAGHYRDLVLKRLAAFGYDLRGKIRSEHLFTPLEIERMTGARRGALYGISNHLRTAAFRRPHNRCQEVRGLYFAGGTTHPGGGVPMVILSGKAAAGMALEDGFA